MAFDYDAAQLRAQRLIHENGRTITLVQRSRTPTDPAKPWLGTESTDTATSIIALFIPSGQIQGAMGVRSMFRDEEVMDKKQAFIAALDLTENLESFDFVQDEGLVYSIDQVRTLNPGPKRILHELLLETVK